MQSIDKVRANFTSLLSDLPEEYEDYIIQAQHELCNEKFLNVDVTIWVEGWQKFQAIEGEEGYSSIWNNKYIDAGFQVGFEFAVNSIEELNP